MAKFLEYEEIPSSPQEQKQPSGFLEYEEIPEVAPKQEATPSFIEYEDVPEQQVAPPVESETARQFTERYALPSSDALIKGAAPVSQPAVTPPAVDGVAPAPEPEMLPVDTAWQTVSRLGGLMSRGFGSGATAGLSDVIEKKLPGVFTKSAALSVAPILAGPIALAQITELFEKGAGRKIEAESTPEQIIEGVSSLVGGVASGQTLAGAISPMIKTFKTANAARQALAIRMATTGSMSANRAASQMIQGEDPKIALRDGVINTMASAVGMVPETLIKQGWGNFVGQIATDLAYDAFTDATITGRLDIKDSESVKQWWIQEIPNLASAAVFASRDLELGKKGSDRVFEANRKKVINDVKSMLGRDKAELAKQGEAGDAPGPDVSKVDAEGAVAEVKPEEDLEAQLTEKLETGKALQDQPYHKVRKVAKEQGIDLSDKPNRTEMANRIDRQKATTPPEDPMVENQNRITAENVREAISAPKSGKLKNTFRKWFGQFLPKSAEIAIENRDSEIRAQMYEAELESGELKKAIASEYGKAPKTDDILQINKVLSGEEDISTLPPSVGKVVESLRARVDGLSRQVQDVVLGKVVAKIGERGNLLLEKGWTPDAAYKRAAEGAGKLTQKPTSDEDALVEFVASNLRSQNKMNEADSRLMAQDILAQQAKSGKMGEIEATWRLSKTIEDNIGSYLNRSYRIFDDPKMRGSREAKEKYVNKLMTENADLVGKVAETFMREAGRDMTPDEAVKAVKAMLININGHPVDAMLGGKVKPEELGILMQRNLDDPDMQKLLGRYDDPTVNYLRSVSKMASFLASNKAYKATIDDGMREGFLSRNAQGDKVHEVNLTGEKFYADKMTADAFDDMATKNHGEVYKIFMQAVGAIKWAKTIGSVPGQVRNFLANPKLLIRQGIVDPRRMIRTIGELYKGKNQFNELVKEWNETGMIGEGVRSGELREMIQWMNKNDVDISEISSIRNPKTGKIDPLAITRKGMKAPAKMLAKMWEYGDSIFKITAYEAEKDRYRKANPDWTEAQVKERAMEIAKQTMPTYSRTPKIIKSIRKNPLIGTFPSFAAEIIRTEYNTYKLASQEIKSDNAAVKAIGWKRLAGMASNHILSAAIPAAINMLSGRVSKEEEEDARRTIVPPWSKNSDLAWIKKGDEWAWIDMSFSDPMAILHNPVRAAGRVLKDAAKNDELGDVMTEGLATAIGAFAKEILQPFVAEDILTKRLVQARVNADEFGRPIRNPEAPVSDQVADTMWWLLKEGIPGTVSQANRIYKGMTGETTRSGRKYNVADEIKGLFGLRINRMVPAQALMFKSFDHKKRWETIRQNYSSDMANKAASQADLSKGMDIYKTSFDNWTDDIIKDLNAFRRLGVSEREIRSRIKAMRLPRDVYDYILRGGKGANRPTPKLKFLPQQRKAEIRSLQNK